MSLMSGMESAMVGLLNEPAIKAAVLGLVVKFSADQLKKLFKKVDEEGLPAGYKTPVQLLVVMCSGVVTLGNLAMSGQLHTFDVGVITNFFTVALPVYLSSMGIHVGAKSLLKSTTGKETIK